MENSALPTVPQDQQTVQAGSPQPGQPVPIKPAASQGGNLPKLIVLFICSVVVVRVVTKVSEEVAIAYIRVTEGIEEVLANLGFGSEPILRFNAKQYEKLQPLILESATREGLDPALIKAVIYVESRFNPNAKSRRGAIGLMQLMPATAADMGVSNPYSPSDNIRGGSKYLRWLMRRFDGNLSHVLAGYNAGPNAVKIHGGIPPYRETRHYVREVLKLYGHFKRQDERAVRSKDATVG